MPTLVERQAEERIQKQVQALQRRQDNKYCFDCGCLVRVSKVSTRLPPPARPRRPRPAIRGVLTHVSG